MSIALAFFALLVEAILGYPDWLVRTIGHPVTWMGRLIGVLDRGLNRQKASRTTRRLLGLLAILLIVVVAALAGHLLERSLLRLPLGFAVAAIAASTLIAQRSLYHHVRRVAVVLEEDTIAAARAAVSHIVGRDPDALDEAGIARAAIESLAENFSDGVLAPAFWLALGGLAGGAAYKAVNTADSMIGHLDERYAAFGWATARLDDLVNLPASRLSALWLVAAAALLPGTSAREAARAVQRDAAKHRSPNAGWPEAAMAGALGLRLAGPRVYGETLVDDAFMGEGRREATVADIRRGVNLYRLACVIQASAVALLALIVRV